MMTNDQLRAENQAIRAMLAQGIERSLLSLPNVLHVSVGLKQSGGRLSDQLCVRVYVNEKKPLAELRPEDTIPLRVHGIPTDVNVVGAFEFSEDNTRYRPIKGGIQITNRIIDLNEAGNGTQISRGTLGCIAIDTTDNSPVILSNWHVLYGENGRNGDKVYQPPPTSVPPTNLADLPLRPNDNTDKIAVLRRSSISSSVDGAIAAIDVSSCCHCCGIHFSNEVNGLSVANRPPRNTIVGDERAVSGMVVFKVGKSTGRSEGIVVDDNHPTFSISRGSSTYTFSGQIAIQNKDPLSAFSAHGDSGSVLINLNNKIVGLLFAAGKKITVKGVEQPFISIANHISDVFTALKIQIPYSPDVKVTAGTLAAADAAQIFEAPIPEPYRRLRAKLEADPPTAALVRLAQMHADEVTWLVNHCRPVTVAWRRNQAPAILATIMSSIRDGRGEIPRSVNGVAPHELLLSMRDALVAHGSRQLRASLESVRFDVKALLCECGTVDELMDRFRHAPQLLSGETLSHA